METFKNNKISIMLNKSVVNKVPDGYDWREYYRAFKRAALTPHIMAGVIWQGYGFTPCYSKGRRIEENFTEAYHIAFDFDNINGKWISDKNHEVDAINEAIDNIDFIMPTGYFECDVTKNEHGNLVVMYQYGTESSSLDFLMRPGTLADMLASFAYSTPSSSPDHPKSRVVFVIPEPITSPQEFRNLYQAIAAEFEREGSHCDPACKDPLRIYYGSKDCDMRTNWSALLPDDIGWLTNRYVAENPPPKKLVDATVTYVTDDNTVQDRINHELEKIVMAADGEKHHTLNKVAYTIGGFAGNGHIPEHRAVDQLKAAIVANGRAEDLKAAYKTIETAVSKGMARPLSIEKKTKRDMDELL